MVKELLVEAAIGEAARLLSELDRTQFPVDSMFWVQLPDTGHWRLILGSPLIRDQGARIAYERLGAILRATDLGLSLSNISIFEPDSTELRSLLSTVEMSGRLVAGPSWLTFGEGVVYRWTADAIRAELSCELTASDLSQIWEVERKLINLPKLLFSTRDHGITIRFHPQHGPRADISDVRKDLQHALHRVRPECQIKWRLGHFASE
jgi:hypothetical protein